MSSFDGYVATLDAAILRSFGTSVTYAPRPTGTAFTLTAVIEPPMVTEETAASTFLSLFVRLSDFSSAPKKGDRVTIGTKIYTVFDVRADLEGGATLSLQET